MKLLIVVFLTVTVGCRAETAADMAKRIMNMGQVFCSQTEVQNLCSCMETPVYQQQSEDKLLQAAMSCAASKVSTLKYANGMSVLNNFNQCLSPETWQTVYDKVKTEAVDVYGPLLKEMNGTLSAWKAAGKSQAQCISDGYKMLLNKVANATLLNNMCTKIVKQGVVSKQEWACALQYAPTVVDLSKYSCAKLTPPK